MHELDNYDDSIFITLTYTDDMLPANGSLVKTHLQKFFKRLRKNISVQDKNRRIRYFACGEYGEKSQRPHYHAIVFGLSLSQNDRQLVIDSWTYCDWSNPAIRSGSFGMAEPDSINYVAQYIDKKFSGDIANEEYLFKSREPVFKLSSLGIGRDYCDKQSANLRHFGAVAYRGKMVNLPRYYLDRLGIPSDDLRPRAIEKDMEEVKILTGFDDMTMDDVYYRLKPDQVRSVQERVLSGKKQHNANLEAKVRLKQKKI